MKRDIENFMAKCLNYQQVKVEHQKPRGLTEEHYYMEVGSDKHELHYELTSDS